MHIPTRSKSKQQGSKAKNRNYSLCRASCSVCPYHKGLLKLLDHGVPLVPTLPVPEEEAETGIAVRASAPDLISTKKGRHSASLFNFCSPVSFTYDGIRNS